MSMKKNLFLIFSLLLWVPVALPAQVVEKVLDIFHADSLQASEIRLIVIHCILPLSGKNWQQPN